MFGQFSGSQGNTTASHNRYGSYVRNRTIPVNPNSTAQQDVRSGFASFTKTWRELTESQRTGWADLAAQIPILDPQGQSIVLAGNSTFMRYNLARRAVGASELQDPPPLDTPPQVTTATLTATDAAPGPAALTVAYSALDGTANNFLIVRASAPRSVGKTYVSRGEMKQITSVAGDAASPLDIQTAYEAVYGTSWELQPGMEIVVELVGVSENGLMGSTFRAVATIT